MAKEEHKGSGRREGKSKSRDITNKKKFTPKPAQKRQAPKPKGPADEMRLNKYIANSGMCSRREADLYISTGQVQVNGKVVTEMGHKVKLSDDVKFDGRRINPEKKEYILLNKPKGFDTSTSEETLHKSAAGLVMNASKYKLVPVGRLQRNTTGLLLFTNDHDMQKKLTDTGLLVRKIYQVSLDKNLKYEDFQKIEEGPTIEGKKVRVDSVSYVDNAPKSEIGIQLHSNRNNIVRKIFESFGYDVIKLDRVSYAGLTKKDLPRGNWRHLTAQELANLQML
ncbi:MAG: pseudouridine synthase [Flavobacteriaceae bacterium]